MQFILLVICNNHQEMELPEFNIDEDLDTDIDNLNNDLDVIDEPKFLEKIEKQCKMIIMKCIDNECEKIIKDCITGNVLEDKKWVNENEKINRLFGGKNKRVSRRKSKKVSKIGKRKVKVSKIDKRKVKVSKIGKRKSKKRH